MIPAADFAPGTVLGERYRIVSVLGRGGMGEVYRAEDLMLGEVVALKFLPRRLASDPERVAQLIDEVRIGRQTSHSNVCRIHDIGEVNGRHYLSMNTSTAKIWPRFCGASDDSRVTKRARSLVSCASVWQPLTRRASCTVI